MSDSELPTDALDGCMADALLESIADGISVVDEDGCHLRLNSAMAEMVGWSVEELIAAGPPPHPYWPAEHVAGIEAAMRRTITGHLEPIDLVFCRRDGRRFPVLVHPARARWRGRDVFIATVRDMTERRARESRLAELRRLVGVLLDGGGLALWEWSLIDGVATVSDGYFTQLGYPPKAWVPTLDAFLSRVHPEDVEVVRGKLRGLAEGRLDLYDAEFRYRHADGGWRWLLGRGWVTECDQEGRPIRITGTQQDIGRLKAQETQVRQFQKMEVLGQLTGGLAHDFNNVLTVFRANLELAQECGREAQEPYFADMDRALQQATHLTGSLLRYARGQRGRRSCLDLKVFLSGAASMLRAAVTSGVVLELEPSEGRHPVLVESSALEHALLNLVVNARDAVAGVPGGRVQIGTGRREVDEPEASCLAVRPGTYEILWVEDNGRGMDSEVLARATEPLFTTKPEGLGTGLGLSMVRRAVEESDGFVSLTSRPGVGTRVALCFPTAKPPAVEERAVPRGASTKEMRPAQVLLVDDEPIVLSATRTLLETLGCDVMCAYTPEEAQAAAARAEVALLITDIALGTSMNGVELATALRGKHPELQVLFITGFATGQVLEEARRLGPVVWKPFGVDALRGEVQTLLSGRS